MADVIRALWSSTDPESGQTATISFTYDNVALRILSFTVNNPTTKTITFSATSTSTGKNYNGTINPGVNTTINMNPGAQNRLDISVTPNGRVDGVEYQIEFG